MLEPGQIFDERATTYATGTDCWNILTDEMHSLYLLSFLLTADLKKAEQCFVSGLGECEEEIGVFMTWAQTRARRRILNTAIWMIMPAPDRATPRTGFSQGRRRAFHKVRATKLFAMPPAGSRRSPLWHRWRLTCLSWHLSTIPSDISATAPWRVPTAANGRSPSPRRGST